jgi:hypothetical protein|tara:strand:+ start:1011 stop:1229 length:219 start_codon:yes stop_codon:yes gene_type:complete
MKTNTNITINNLRLLKTKLSKEQLVQENIDLQCLVQEVMMKGTERLAKEQEMRDEIARLHSVIGRLRIGELV